MGQDEPALLQLQRGHLWTVLHFLVQPPWKGRFKWLSENHQDGLEVKNSSRGPQGWTYLRPWDPALEATNVRENPECHAIIYICKTLASVLHIG